MKNLFKIKSSKPNCSSFESLNKKQMRKVFGGETTPTKVVNVGNTIVDDLNGLIR